MFSVAKTHVHQICVAHGRKTIETKRSNKMHEIAKLYAVASILASVPFLVWLAVPRSKKTKEA